MDLLKAWVLSKLEAVADQERVLLRDPLHLLPKEDGTVHAFALKHGFTAVEAATNLAFRDLYERTVEDAGTRKILLYDRTPSRRKMSHSSTKAPPLFYPDFVAQIPAECQIDLDLKEFLIERTGDSDWPSHANDPQYARLIAQNLGRVLRAHENLWASHPRRFTDNDFKTIVGYAALSIPEAAFKKDLNPEVHWKIGLLHHRSLTELEALAPEITKPIKDRLAKARAPFCWFADHDPEMVVRAFYLSVILRQHFDHWSLLLANIDSAMRAFSSIELEVLDELAPKITKSDPERAETDLSLVEQSLPLDALKLLLIDQMKLDTPKGFVSAIQRESYSTLVRSLALLMALDDQLSTQPAAIEQAEIKKSLFSDLDDVDRFVDSRCEPAWSHLKEAYRLAGDICSLRGVLGRAVKDLKVTKTHELDFRFFKKLFNDRKVSKLEYYISAIERLLNTKDVLPRSSDELPSVFGEALQRTQEQVRAIGEEVSRQLDVVNLRFQDMVAAQYPTWVTSDSDVRLTSQFMRRCLKSHWDPEKQKAVIFVFDGMRYDIWEEFIRPVFEEAMDIEVEYSASSLLPSETHISRKAISAGTYSDEFDTRMSEDKLLKTALAREFGFEGEVEVLSSEETSTGEAVHYRAGNLDVHIFELCDQELHRIKVREHADGRVVPRRPLVFIYEQLLKDIIDNEVRAVVREIKPGTKVFVTADHGFVKLGRKKVRLEQDWLNESNDCFYQYARLLKPLAAHGAAKKVTDRVIELPASALRIPTTETARNQLLNWDKQYASVIFPRPGCALSRPEARFDPPAFSHGGISVQELMIPMVVMRVREKENATLILGKIEGPEEVVEGQEAEFSLSIKRAGRALNRGDEIKVDIEASYCLAPDKGKLPQKFTYLTTQEKTISYRFLPDPSDATDEERRQGSMSRTLKMSVTCPMKGSYRRKSKTHSFTIRLDSERITRRVPPRLGKILGLTPKSMK